MSLAFTGWSACLVSNNESQQNMQTPDLVYNSSSQICRSGAEQAIHRQNLSDNFSLFFSVYLQASCRFISNGLTFHK